MRTAGSKMIPLFINELKNKPKDTMERKYAAVMVGASVYNGTMEVIEHGY